jgi:hypothetical protein
MSRKRRYDFALVEPASRRHANYPSKDSSTSTVSSHRDAADTRTCLVCDETNLVTKFPRIPQVSSHGHGNDICYECYALHLEVEVDNKMWDQVSCPQCPMLLQEDEINVLSTPLTWQNYRRFVERATLSKNPDYRHCFSASCDSGQMHDGALVFSCQTCHHKPHYLRDKLARRRDLRGIPSPPPNTKATRDRLRRNSQNHLKALPSLQLPDREE